MKSIKQFYRQMAAVVLTALATMSISTACNSTSAPHWEVLHSWTLPRTGIAQIVPIPDRSNVVLGFNDGSVRIFDYAVGRENSVDKYHALRVSSVGVSPDSRYVLSSAQDNKLVIRDLKSSSHSEVALPSSANCMLFLNERIVLLGCGAYAPQIKSSDPVVADDCIIRLFDVEQRRELGAFAGHTAPVRGLAALDHDTFISSSLDGTIRCWQVSTKHEIGTPVSGEGQVPALTVAAKTGLIVCGNSNGNLLAWTTFGGPTAFRVPVDSRGVGTVDVSPNGKLVAAAGTDWTLHILESTSFRALQTLRFTNGVVWSVKFLDDSDLLTWSADKLELWKSR